MPEIILSKTEKIKELKRRMKSIKPDLLAIEGWWKRITDKHPGYNTITWFHFKNNMLALRSTDEDLLEIMEDLVKKENRKKSKK